VQLAQTQQLENLLHLGRHANDTANSDHEYQLLLCLDENLTLALG
jgi:hypothetical protein